MVFSTRRQKDVTFCRAALSGQMTVQSNFVAISVVCLIVKVLLAELELIAHKPPILTNPYA